VLEESRGAAQRTDAAERVLSGFGLHGHLCAACWLAWQRLESPLIRVPSSCPSLTRSWFSQMSFILFEDIVEVQRVDDKHFNKVGNVRSPAVMGLTRGPFFAGQPMPLQERQL
jgi:hypothetical protein